MGGPEGFLGGPGGLLEGSREGPGGALDLETQKGGPPSILGPILGRLGAQVGTQNRAKTAPKKLQNLAQILTSSWTPLRAVAAPNLGPKTAPRRAQKSSRNELRREARKSLNRRQLHTLSTFGPPTWTTKRLQDGSKIVRKRSSKQERNKTRI